MTEHDALVERLLGELAEKDAEVKRLREALKKILRVATERRSDP